MSEVVVVGGGIAGCACAYELAKAGARVTLLEYGKAGMQATNAAAGMLAPVIEAGAPGPMVEFGLRALRSYPAMVAEVEAACGFGVEFRPGGILKVAFTDAQAEELRARLAWQRTLGEPIEWLDASLCRELEPRLDARVTAGVFTAAEGSVSNQLLTLGLERAARALGTAIEERTPVTGFKRRGGRVTAVIAGERAFPCDAVVLAAGARSGQLARRLGARLAVEPVRGQMIALGGMRPPVRHVVWGPDGYLVPRANGLVFAGATVERVGFRRRTTRAGERRLRTMARRLVPQLAAATVPFAWAGLRPGTADGLPYIGPLPECANVVAATGHYRNGILLGPLTGALVAAGLASGDWAQVAAFSPSRPG